MAPAGLDTGRPHSKPPRDVDKLSPSGACSRVVAGAFYCLRDEPLPTSALSRCAASC